MLTTQSSAGLRHARDSPIAHARESFIDLYFGIIPFVQRSLQFLQLITVHINSPVLWNWPVNVDINLTWIKILARGICCQNENESVMNTVFTDPRRRRSGRVRRLRKNPIQCSFKLPQLTLMEGTHKPLHSVVLPHWVRCPTMGPFTKREPPPSCQKHAT